MNESLPPEKWRNPQSLPYKRQLILLAWLVSGLVALIAIVLIARALLSGHDEQPPAAEPGTFRPTSDQMAALKILPVASVIFHTEQITDGKIATDDDTTTPVFSPYSGRVTRLIAKAGDVVEQGQPLFAIQASEFVQGQNDLITAAANARTTEAQLQLARTNEKRQHELFQAKGGALKDWQQSQVDLANAEGTYRTAEIALAAVRNRLRILGKSDKEITAIETAPDSVKMNPEAVVPAPIGGTIIQRQISVGQYINSAAGGATSPVLSIGNLSTVWLVANVREVDASQVHVGEPVEVHVLAYPDRVFKARLTYVGSTVDDNTRRVSVRAEVDNPDGALKPEMFATFHIITSADSTAPGVPDSAVVYEGDTARVWVARDSGTLELRQIKRGRALNGMIEVLEGVKAGEKIVTAGTLFIDRAAQGD